MSLFAGLAKTRGGLLAKLFGAKDPKVTPEWLEALEEALLRADVAVTLVDPVMAQARDLVAHEGIDTVPKVLDAVRQALVGVLATRDLALNAGASVPRVILVVGVNGSGKTTTAAKLAKRAEAVFLRVVAKVTGSLLMLGSATCTPCLLLATPGPSGITFGDRSYHAVARKHVVFAAWPVRRWRSCRRDLRGRNEHRLVVGAGEPLFSHGVSVMAC